MAVVDSLLTAAGVPCGVVQRVDEVIAHPAVTATMVEHPVLGRISLPGPSLVTTTSRTDHSAPPLINENERDILDQL
jgi:crotonobetainyl-CoA:carnitine CoA-transferase CaiB-like acyl-CoA transferase